MICPLMVNGLLSIGTSETNDIEGVKKCIECLKEKCAWWEWLEWKDKNKKEGRCLVAFLPMMFIHLGNINRALRD